MNAKKATAAKKTLPDTFFTRFTTGGGPLPFVVSILFLITVAGVLYTFTGHFEGSAVLIIAAVFGGYMALNIGANDVANNVAPAVGAKTLTLAGALVIAAIFEAAGALIAGGNVVSTISKGIINPDLLGDVQVFIFLMLSALLAGAIWINLATWVGAPVSTTHAIVGAVMGAGMAAAGVNVVNWPTMGAIAASWVISPLMGGAIASLLYWMISALVLDQKNKLEAAKKWVPIFIAVMVAAFTMYLLTKGAKHLVKLDMIYVVLLGLSAFIATPFLLRKPILAKAAKLQNRPRDISKLFNYPLIISAALLSFAHGANDVANAVGPLAAIVSAISESAITATASIPIWVMIVGAIGISLGLMLFGAKIVNTVGESITKLDQIRAYCVVLSAAVTVIIASAFGLPVSSTHIAVGSIFGVGLYREQRHHSKRKKKHKKMPMHRGGLITRRKLVRRKHLMTIITAWVITVPCASFIAAIIFLFLSRNFLPCACLPLS